MAENIIPELIIKQKSYLICEKIRDMLTFGWTITLRDGMLDAYAGDSNCPIIKDYDPKDGHGYTEFEAYGSLEEMVDKLYEKHAELKNEKV